MTAAIVAELSALLEEVRALRRMYPPGWDYDPLFRVEKRLERLLDEIRQ